MLMEQGSNARTVGATKVNEASSRSHAVFIVIVEKSTSGLADTHRSAGGTSPAPDPALAPSAPHWLPAARSSLHAVIRLQAKASQAWLPGGMHSPACSMP